MKIYTVLGLFGLCFCVSLGGCQGTSSTRSLEEYTQVGMAKMARGDYKGAIEEFDAALGGDPNNPNILISRGLAKERQGQLLMAIEDYTLALMEKPDSYEALIYRGNARNQLPQWDLALADFTEAIALQPNNGTGFSNRAVTYYSLGLIKEAIADLEEAKQVYEKTNDAAKIAETNQLLEDFQASL